ncbi:MAG: OadG family protein [Candidatus Hatepunaea meridiana]|nr:OadG family protein [Candidatus Hatepunaea meridiana]
MNVYQTIIEGQGLSLMFVGMTVVFSALLVLMFMMKGLKLLLKWQHNRHIEHERLIGSTGDCLVSNPNEITGVVIAAIALTLILEDDQIHDVESMVLTMHAMPKPYSNWWMPSIQREPPR